MSIDQHQDQQVADVIELIAAGEADRHLDAIVQVIARRRTAINIAEQSHFPGSEYFGGNRPRRRLSTTTTRAERETKTAAMAIGSRVRFNDKTRPKYIQGLEGTVTKINQVSVTVDLDQPARKFHKGIRVPINLVDAL